MSRDKDNRISISKMAGIHNISRQTLIFYDKIGLFRPQVVDENGYRYYTYEQIPFLREICFLKNIGVKLEDIKEHIENRSDDSAIELLQRHSDEIDKEIDRLIKIKRNIHSRISVYENAHFESNIYQPVIKHLPERRVLLYKWRLPEPNDTDRKILHTTLMTAWREAEANGCYPSAGWGAAIKYSDLSTSTPLGNAGSYINISSEDYAAAEGLESLKIFPEGDYACMYKYGMPYELDHILNLLDWIEENGYEVSGDDILDDCFLDTTFYNNAMRQFDFCQLQIPVRKKEK
ncbi:MAG: MerR family transcriptional regulator [Oscillospiraceae bacterium]|nr:MerR family transcriptional regulator [Oscillospiraceae bacterium]